MEFFFKLIFGHDPLIWISFLENFVEGNTSLHKYFATLYLVHWDIAEWSEANLTAISTKNLPPL